MKTRLVIGIALLGALFMGVAVPQVQQLALGRTGSELGLFLLLNGERTRSIQSDGGGLALWTTDAGVATISVTGGSVLYVENAGTTICHICGPLADSSWDAGCSTTTSDPNYGSPVAVGGYRWISLRDTTTTIKAVPPSGSAAINCPVFYMR